jgi:hypothetical protein
LKNQVKSLQVEIQDNRELVDKTVKLMGNPDKVKDIEIEIEEIKKKMGQVKITENKD